MQIINLLFGAVFVAMLTAIPIYSILIERYKRHKLVPGIAFILVPAALGWGRCLLDSWQQGDQAGGWIRRSNPAKLRDSILQSLIRQLIHRSLAFS